MSLLRAYGVPVDSWGKGVAKSVDDLFLEIQEGESSLEALDIPHALVRHVRVACIDVVIKNRNDLYMLVEDSQVFTDGRKRSRKLETSVSEKLDPGEDSHDGASRALKEELGFATGYALYKVREETETIDSPSYPGLTAKFQRFFFVAWIQRCLYKPEGYVEDDGKKKTFFVWKAVKKL